MSSVPPIPPPPPIPGQVIEAEVITEEPKRDDSIIKAIEESGDMAKRIDVVIKCHVYVTDRYRLNQALNDIGTTFDLVKDLDDNASIEVTSPDIPKDALEAF